MKKTVRVNINGIVFNIDDDAYSMLRDYLDAIHSKFLDEEEGTEIIADIEARIAELFQQDLTDSNQVITTIEVDGVIAILGRPEDFDDVESNYEEETKPEQKTTRRRCIFRDPDNRMIGGVSSGIGSYFGIDPIIVRAAFVLGAAFFGTTIFLYFLFWIAIPEAKNSAQKLEMKGEPVNLSNIEKTIKEELNTVKQNFDKFRAEKQYRGIRHRISQIISFFLNALTKFLKGIVKFFGVIFLFVGIVALAGIIGTLFFSSSIFSPISWTGNELYIYESLKMFSSTYSTMGLIGIFLLVTIPILGLIYISLKMIFKIRTKNKLISLIGIGLWVVGLIFSAIFGLSIAKNFQEESDDKKTYEIQAFQSDTLYLETTTTKIKHRFFRSKTFAMAKNNKNEIELYISPRIRISQSKNDKMEISVRTTAHGATEEKANKFASNVRYDWSQVDSLLSVNAYYGIPKNQPWTPMEITIEIKIPVGKSIYFGKKLKYLLWDVDNIQDIWDRRMVQKMWIMTPSGLCLTDEYVKNPEKYNMPKSFVEKETDPKDLQKLDELEEVLDSL